MGYQGLWDKSGMLKIDSKISKNTGKKIRVVGPEPGSAPRSRLFIPLIFVMLCFLWLFKLTLLFLSGYQLPGDLFFFIPLNFLLYRYIFIYHSMYQLLSVITTTESKLYVYHFFYPLLICCCRHIYLR